MAMLQSLTADDIHYMAEQGTLRRYPANSDLIFKGDDSDSLYIIRSGKVKIYDLDENGDEVIYRYQTDGEFFGEMALFDPAPRSAYVKTVTDATIVYVTRQQFHHCLAERPEMAVNMIPHLIQRIRDLSEALSDCALRSVYQRVRKQLELIAESDGPHRVIPHPPKHQELAAMVGSRREMVTRIINALERQGYIQRTEQKSIILLKPLPRNLSTTQ